MSFKKPIIIPIPMSHLNSSNNDTTIVGPPTILRVTLSSDGWDYYKKTILPYVWDGYNVRLKIQNTTSLPTTDADAFKTTQVEFIVKGDTSNGTSGTYGFYIGFPTNNNDTNTLYRHRDKLYTKDGVDYSAYSYVIYA